MKPFSEYARPAEGELDALWSEGMLSTDANVLLNLYNLSPSSREAVFGYFSSLDDGRLWMAHQALVEFHRHRVGRRQQVSQQLAEIRNTVRDSTKTIKRQLGRYPSLNSTRSKVAKALESASQGVEAERKRHVESLGDVDDDPIVQKLHELFRERTGAELSAADVEREGEHRFPREIPPGFADAEAKGPGRRYGDLYIWLELLQHAKAEGRPVLFLTEDSKDDWWWNRPDSPAVPHPELRREMFDVAGVPYWQYTLDGFLR